MTCEATWIVASFHSTSWPFIQILPVPGNAMTSPLRGIVPLLRLAAEWATVGTGVQRLAAVPAESRLRRVARLETGLDLLRRVGDGGRVAVEERRARRAARRRG